MGIWVFYYLLFTNYAGIGLIETTMIVTLTLSEVPTGAIGDLLGKKLTLFLSFLLQFAGNVFMGIAGGLGMLIVGVIIASIGGTLYSGTAEALAFDSLKQEGRTNEFDRVTAKMRSFSMIAMAVSSVLGGWLYLQSPQFPFLAFAGACLLGSIICLLIKEPKIDTEKFSLLSFINQNKQGFRQIFSNYSLKKVLFLMFSISAIVVLHEEMLSDILAYEFGFKVNELATFSAVILVIAAISSQFAPRMLKKFGETKSLLTLSLVFAATYLIAPFAGIIVGAVSILIFWIAHSIFGNIVSVGLNNRIESRYRATALSVFNMVKNLPYVFTAFVIGYLMDIYSAKVFTGVIGLVMLFCIGLWKITQIRQTK